MKKAQLLAGLMFLGASIYIVVEASRMKYYDAIGPGAGFFPLWLGLILCSLSLGCLAQVWRSGRADPEERFLPSRQGMTRLAIIVVALVLFVALLNPIGFRLDMLAFLFFLLAVLGRQNILTTVVIALLGSFGSYYAFNNWLGVPLPSASLEWLQGLGL
jgi:putative tricarboxylic transport membrane protein